MNREPLLQAAPQPFSTLPTIHEDSDPSSSDHLTLSISSSSCSSVEHCFTCERVTPIGIAFGVVIGLTLLCFVMWFLVKIA